MGGARIAREGAGPTGLSQQACAKAIRLAQTLVPDARIDIVPADGAGEEAAGDLIFPVGLPNGSVAAVLRLAGVAAPEPNVAERLQDVVDLLACDLASAEAARKRRAADRAARTAWSTLSAVIQAAPLSMALTDFDQKLLAVSPQLVETLGWEGRAILGHTLYELAPQIFEHWREGYTAVLAGEDRPAQRFPMKDRFGRPAWYEGHARVWKRADGRIGGLIITWHAITDMMEALDRTARSEDRLKLAMEISDMHVWEMDYRRQELIKVGAEDTFFDEPVTFEGLAADIYSSVDERDLPHVREAWRRHFREGAPYNPEYRLKRKDGREVWTACTLKLINDPKGRPLRLIGAMRNVTASKRSEQQLLQAKEEAEAANRAKSTFLATMSHEIRTPLNGVLGMAQAMAADDLTPAQRMRLDVIRQSGEALLAILNDVLDLSKIEAGKLELEQAEFDIAELARDAHAAFGALAREKGLAFSLRVDPRARGLYRGDPLRIRQILFNLVSNALKFTERGAVTVHVSQSRQSLKLTVKDTGIGIDPVRAMALFQKFEQADASTTRRFGGTGLGLSICRELAELMGGSIAVESRPGQGATFRVVLPLERVGDSRPAPRADIRSGPNRKAPALRVLAAEDNPVNQLVLTTLLGQAGLEPLIVENGRSAVEAWESGQWDVILMDVQMPEMDGPTATRAIRAREAETGRARTPILALTANAMSHQEAEYLACGMDAIIPKPIEVERLFAILQQVLDGAARVRAA